MIHKTTGIVLSSLKYKEKSIIVKIYTKDFGVRSYIINGVRQKNSSKVALYQPLMVLDLVVYEKASSSIQRISEAKVNRISVASQYDIVRTSITLFIAEVLSKILQNEGEADDDLFQFIMNSIHYLNRQKSAIENFHLIFLIKLCAFIGFDFNSNTADTDVRSNLKLINKQSLRVDELKLLDEMNLNDFDKKFELSSQLRVRLLQFLLQYYETHISSLAKINSLEVLIEVFS